MLFWKWLTSYPLRWTRLAFGGALLYALALIVGKFAPNVNVPSGGFLGYNWCDRGSFR